MARKSRSKREGGSFVELMNAAVGSFERPKPLPAGTYRGEVLPPKRGKSFEKRTPFIQYRVKPTEALTDVDKALLPEDWQDKALGLDKMYLTKKAMWKNAEFFRDVGLDENQSLTELIPAAVGIEVYFGVEVEQDDEDPEREYNRVTFVQAEAPEED